MDYMMKARASSGLRAPARHGTLSLQTATDLRLLADHCQALGLLPPPLGAPPAPPAPYWDPVTHMTAAQLLPYQDPALPYTCFTASSGTDPHLPLHLCYSDSRLPHTEVFTWEDLKVIGSLPNYCRQDPAGFSPLVVEVPENEVERIRWGIHSLCQHTKTQQPGPTPAFVATGPEPTWPPGLCPNRPTGCYAPWSRAPTPSP